MNFVGINGGFLQCAFSKKLIINGKNSRDIFLSLYNVLKLIVYQELSDNGSLNIKDISESDVNMLKNRMLEFGIDLFIECHEGKFGFNEKYRSQDKLKDFCIILSSEHTYKKIYFDYALLSSEPHHLE